MGTTQLFFVQLFTAFLVWLAVAVGLVAPWLRTLDRRDALTAVVLPQLFRYIGVTVAVPSVTGPDIPRHLAEHIAIGDELTAVLALLAFAALRLRLRNAVLLVWLVGVIGFADQIMTMARASSAGLAEHMHAAWYIPTVILPMMTASHVLIFYVLMRTQVSRRMLSV